MNAVRIGLHIIGTDVGKNKTKHALAKTLLVNVAASTARMFTARGPARCQPSQRARWRTNRLKTFTDSREKVPTRS